MASHHCIRLVPNIISFKSSTAPQLGQEYGLEDWGAHQNHTDVFAAVILELLAAEFLGSWAGKDQVEEAKLPSGKRLQVAMKKIAIEIVSFPIKHGDFP